MSEPITMRSTKAEIFAAYSAAIEPKEHHPIERMEIARLVACGSPEQLAGWVIDRLCCAAIRDPHAADTVAAVQVYLAANALISDPPA